MARTVRRKATVTTDPNVVTDRVANWEATTNKKVPKGPASRIQKVVSLHISVGDEDRGRTFEEFMEHLEKLLKKVPYGEKGNHVTRMGGHYIIDGLVCLPSDYDAKRQTFKKGAAPPSWAGGPPPVHQAKLYDVGSKYASSNISAKEYDKKYGPGGNPNVKKYVHPDNQLEELDWGDADIDDVEQHEEIAAQTIKRAKKILKTASAGSAKKKVVKKNGAFTAGAGANHSQNVAAKKNAAAPKKVVRRKK